MFHITYLHTYLGLSPALPPPPFPLDNASAGEYRVEDILDLYLGHFGTKSLVKWVNYPVVESTWEPASHLDNRVDILYQFLYHHGWKFFSLGSTVLNR